MSLQLGDQAILAFNRRMIVLLNLCPWNVAHGKAMPCIEQIALVSAWLR